MSDARGEWRGDLRSDHRMSHRLQQRLQELPGHQSVRAVDRLLRQLGLHQRGRQHGRRLRHCQHLQLSVRDRLQSVQWRLHSAVELLHGLRLQRLGHHVRWVVHQRGLRLSDDRQLQRRELHAG